MPKIKTVEQLCIGDIITHAHGLPAGVSSQGSLNAAPESVIVTQLRCDGTPDSKRVHVFGASASGSEGSATL